MPVFENIAEDVAIKRFAVDAGGDQRLSHDVSTQINRGYVDQPAAKSADGRAYSRYNVGFTHAFSPGYLD
jgi:hypothetical protein